MTLAAVAMAAVLLSSAQDGHRKGKRIRPDGRFAKTYKTDGGGTYKIRGTLRGRRVRHGRVDVNVSTCEGHDKWTARRASP